MSASHRVRRMFSRSRDRRECWTPIPVPAFPTGIWEWEWKSSVLVRVPAFPFPRSQNAGHACNLLKSFYITDSQDLPLRGGHSWEWPTRGRR